MYIYELYRQSDPYAFKDEGEIAVDCGDQRRLHGWYGALAGPCKIDKV